MNCKSNIICMLVIFSCLTTGCQSGKWKMPEMPKMTLWKDGGPKLFAKKDKNEMKGPPPKYFGDESLMADNDSDVELNLEPGKPQTASTMLPSDALQPERAMSTNVANNTAKNSSAGGTSDSSGTKGSFVTPQVAAADPQQTPAIRKPYEYRPESTAGMMQAAEKLASDWDNVNTKAKDSIDSFTSDFEAGKAALGNTAKNQINSTVKEFGSFEPLRPATNTPPASSTASSADASTNNGFAANTGSFAASNPSATTTSPLSSATVVANEFVKTTPTTNAVTSNDISPSSPNPSEYPRTAQAANGFESLSKNNLTPQNRDSANRDAFVTTQPASSAFASTPANISKSSSEFPATKNQEYQVQTPATAAPGERPSRVAGLPEQLLKANSSYTPGSTARFQGSLY